MASEKLVYDIESTSKSTQVTMIRKISFLSYSKRGDYTHKPVANGVHQRGVLLVDTVEAYTDRYLD